MTGRLLVPAITPFAADGSVDHGRLVAHCRLLLEDGADGLAVFGTTSEAASLSVAERMAGLEALVEAGIAPDRLLPGTGCAALPDSVALTRHALGLGCAGVLVLPPFYYKGLSADAVFAAYAALIAQTQARDLHLYHIPQMSGVPITAEVIARLTEAFPGIVRGLKDSSGDWENTAAMIAGFPDLAIYPASEAVLSQALRLGAAGCISATANVNAKGIAALLKAAGTETEATAQAAATAVRRAFEALPMIPGVKAAVARRLGDTGYALVRPPLLPLGPEHRSALETAARLAFGRG